MSETSAKETGSGFNPAILLAVIALATVVLVVYLTFTRETLQALANFNLGYLVLIVIGLMVLVSFDSFTTMIFAKAANHRVTNGIAFQSSFLRIFINMITPFGMGGHPFVIAYLKQKGIPSGIGSSVTATKLAVVSLFVLVGGMIGFAVLSGESTIGQGVMVIFGVSLAFQAFLIFALVMLMMRPQAAVWILTRTAGLFRKSRLAANAHGLKRSVIHEAWLTRHSFRTYLKKSTALFLLGCLLHLLMYLAEIVMLWLVFLGLGWNVPFFSCLALASLTLLIMSFLPTPGGAGLTEGAFVLMFSGIAPLSILGVAVVVWRIFYTYLIGLIGLCLSPKTLGLFGRKKNRTP